jgi:hypothetical protein
MLSRAHQALTSVAHFGGTHNFTTGAYLVLEPTSIYGWTMAADMFNFGSGANEFSRHADTRVRLTVKDKDPRIRDDISA